MSTYVVNINNNYTDSTVFNPLNQIYQNWSGMATDTSNNVYVINQSNSSIYEQIGASGDFSILSVTHRYWFSICTAPNGDMYGCTNDNLIYKRTGGTGDFVDMGQASRGYRALCAAPNGDIYAADGRSGGDIYILSGGVGNFTALNQTHRYWNSLCAAPNGDIYASDGDYIYKRTDGSGNFIYLSGAPDERYKQLCAAPNGDIYACCDSNDIYRQDNGTSTFYALNQEYRAWAGITSDKNGNIYASESGGDIYELTKSHSGSSENPFSYSDFIYKLNNSDNNTFQVYGTQDEETGEVTLNIKNNIIEPYLPAINGPYRLYTYNNCGSYIHFNFNDSGKVYGGIFQAFEITGVRTAYGCQFKSSSCGTFETDSSVSTPIVSECSIQAGSIVIPYGHGDIPAQFNNDILIVDHDIEVTGDLLSISHCVTNYTQWPAHTTVNNSQLNWNPIPLPNYDASQSEFRSSILSFGINRPPEPGHNYTYDSGLWGESREGIGAQYFNNPIGLVKYWVASINSNFDSTSWSLSSGGPPNASTPIELDTIVFDMSGNGNCLLDTTVLVNTLLDTTGYSGRIIQQSYSLIIDSDASFCGGSFIGASAPITVGGNLLIQNDFTSTSNVLTSYKNTVIDTNSFSDNSGTFNIITDSSYTFDPNDNSFYNLSFSKDSTVGYRLVNSDSSVKNNLNLNGGYLVPNLDSTIISYGDIYCNSDFGKWTSNPNVLINMISDTTQNIYANKGIIPTLTVNKNTSNQVKLFGQSPLNINGDFILQDSTFNTNGINVVVGK
jgi:hypothetical protein